MEIDIGNALASEATPGISRDALDQLDERVARAHERIKAGRAANEHGYEALNLPETTDVGRINAVVDDLPAPEHVILVGIGGSALGAATVVDALDSTVDLHVLDHLDPAAIDQTLTQVDLSNTVVHVVSRSGQTTETLANALLVKEAMVSAGADWGNRAIVTTGDSGPLRTLAEEDGLPVLSPPAGVPGRFSVLSTMGLPVIALCGHDIGELLAGGQSTVEGLSSSLFDSPAYAFGAISYALAIRGARVNAMMPYAEGLETFAEWFAQLWAESLGKDGLGQIPVRALGVTDQHSQLQLYRAGPRDVQVSFLRVAEHAVQQTVPDGSVATEAGIAGREVAAIADAEFRGTEASLAAASRPSIRLEIPRMDAYQLGALLVSMEAACMLTAELFDVNAFDQPAVEWGKRATRGILQGSDTPETATIEDKRILRID